MDQDLERGRWRVLLWLGAFLTALLVIGTVGPVVAVKTRNALPAGQLAAVAVIAFGGLLWTAVRICGAQPAPRP